MVTENLSDRLVSNKSPRGVKVGRTTRDLTRHHHVPFETDSNRSPFNVWRTQCKNFFFCNFIRNYFDSIRIRRLFSYSADFNEKEKRFRCHRRAAGCLYAQTKSFIIKNRLECDARVCISRELFEDCAPSPRR